MRLPVALASVAILLAASACGGGAPPNGVQPTNREALLPDEFGPRNFYSAYDAVFALRPSWLIRRDLDTEVQVYVDENHVGGEENLRRIRIASVQILRHMDGIAAGGRYGRGHDSGAILVTTVAAGH